MRKKLRVRALWLTFVVAYLLTWVFGVPAVVNEVRSQRLHEAAGLVGGGGPAAHMSESHPWFKVDFVVPVAPCLVLISHGGEAGPRAGYGQWAIYLWYGSDVRVLFKRMTWMS